MIRILLVDDQKMIREAIKVSLESETDLEVVGTADNGITAIEQVEKLLPDVVVMNMEMPFLDGAAATQKITSKFTNTKVLILTSNDSDEYLTKSLAMGAKGYLLKKNGIENIAVAIRSIHQGYTQIAPGLLDRFFIYTDSGIILNKLDTAKYRDLQITKDSNQSSLKPQKTITSLKTAARRQQAEIIKLRDRLDYNKQELPKIQKSLSRNTKYLWFVSLLSLISFALISFFLFKLENKTNSIQLSTIPNERVGLYGEFSLNGIAERVTKAFEQDPILSDISTVYVAQEEDAIVLTGTISDPELLRRMENIAKQISGVNKVYTSQVAIGQKYQENLLGVKKSNINKEY